MKTVKVEIPRSNAYCYPIFIGSNILENTGDFIKKNLKARKLLIVSNKTVFSLYGEKLKKVLSGENFYINFILMEDGEEYKNTASLEKIWEKAIDLKLERKDAIIALGGGVIGDVTGFAAATYLRGIDFIQIPTTLLAQVDSSVGGKVAVNHKMGKNLIGNFYQPKAVIADISVLNSLSEREFKVGLAEVIKYGFIEKSCGTEPFYKSFLSFLKDNKDNILNLQPEITEKLIKHCCELKASVVKTDEKESGVRAILNFGHTIGHAIEKCCGYKNINHGEAVAIGIKGAFLIAHNRGLIDSEYYENSLSILKQYKMNYKTDKNITPSDLYNAMKLDKKVKAGKIRFVLPINFSEVGIFDDIKEEEVIKAVEFLY